MNYQINTTRRIPLLLSVILCAVMLVDCFNWLVAADGQYYRAKEFTEDMEIIAKNTNFTPNTPTNLPPESIQLPLKKAIRLAFQRNVLSLPHEYGADVPFTSSNSGTFHCKARFSGDHVMGIVVEFHNISNSDKTIITQRFHQQFPPYTILFVTV